MARTEIPKFGGENFKHWHNEFQNAMLLLDYEENDGKMARFFQVNLIEGSVAYQWYHSEAVSPEDKRSWERLLPLLRAKFDNSLEDRHNAFVHISTSKLANSQVGNKGPDGEMEHVTWARKLAVANQRAGQDPDNNNVFLVMNNLGDHTRNLIAATGSGGSVARICLKIETMSSTEIAAIKAAVSRGMESSAMRAQLARLERQIMRSPPLSPPEPYQQPFPWRRANAENIDPRSQGPFPQTTEGVEAYKQAVTDFYKQYGANSFASLSRPIPLSPGTDPVGSNECFRCRKSDHLRAQCQANYTLPGNEQRYQGSVMKQKREKAALNPTSTSSMPLGKPI